MKSGEVLDRLPIDFEDPLTELDAFLLGLLQGLTEFFPVSSSGHLVMGQELLGVALPGITFEVVVHMATLLSVLVVYRERIFGLAGGVARREGDALRYVGLLALATLPAGIVGVGFGDPIERLFEAPATVGVALLFTGALLMSSRFALARQDRARAGEGGVGTLTARVALLIGFAQCVALVPGVSRSGSTVVAALWLGLPAVEAAAFSFLLSIPAIGGAAILQLPELIESGGASGGGAAAGAGFAGIGAGPLAIGFVTAAIAGVAAIGLLVRMLKNRSFPAFAWYCWAAGASFLGWLAISG